MAKEQREKIIRFRRQGFGYADIGREAYLEGEEIPAVLRL